MFSKQEALSLPLIGHMIVLLNSCLELRFPVADNLSRPEQQAMVPSGLPGSWDHPTIMLSGGCRSFLCGEEGWHFEALH